MTHKLSAISICLALRLCCGPAIAAEPVIPQETSAAFGALARHPQVKQALAFLKSDDANTMRGVQGRRPPLYAHEKRLASLRVRTLVVVGEEDTGCRKPSEFLGRVLPDARLVVVPKTGHAVNQEEPAEFNRLCLAFIEAVTVAGAAK